MGHHLVDMNLRLHPWSLANTLLAWLVACAVALTGELSAVGEAGEREPCPMCEGTGRLDAPDNKTRIDIECPECHGTGLRPDYGRLIDGSRVRRIRDNQQKRVEFRNKLREAAAKAAIGLGGLLGIPAKIAEVVIAVVVGGLACCGGFLCLGFFAVLVGAGVSIARRKP